MVESGKDGAGLEEYIQNALGVNEWPASTFGRIGSGNWLCQSLIYFSAVLLHFASKSGPMARSR